MTPSQPDPSHPPCGQPRPPKMPQPSLNGMTVRYRNEAPIAEVPTKVLPWLRRGRCRRSRRRGPAQTEKGLSLAVFTQ